MTIPAASPQPQPVLTPLTGSAIFLVLTVDAGGEALVRELLADASSLSRAVGFREPDGELALVVGIGSEAFDRLFASYLARRETLGYGAVLEDQTACIQSNKDRLGME